MGRKLVRGKGKAKQFDYISDEEDTEEQTSYEEVLPHEEVSNPPKKLKTKTLAARKPIEVTSSSVPKASHERHAQSQYDLRVTSPKNQGINIQQATPRSQPLRKRPRIVVETQETQATEESQHIAFNRCNIQAMIRLMNGFPVTPALKDSLKKTPFWHLINAFIEEKVKSDHCRKFDEVVVKIVKSYDANTKTFRLGNKHVKLEREDVKLIFGISCGNEEINQGYCKKEDVQLAVKWKIKGKRLDTSIIKKLLKEKQNSKLEEDMDDIARLLCLCLCGTLFFSTSGTTINWAYVRYVEDLNTIKQYDWVGAICKYLLKSTHVEHKDPKEVKGSSILLLYWLCEHSNILNQESPDSIPRLLKWNITKLRKALKDVKQLQQLPDEKVKDGTLEQTIEEKVKSGFEQHEVQQDQVQQDAGEKDEVNQHEVQVLRERNTGVVIRDEHDIMRLREDDACANDDVEGVPPRVTQPFICSTSIPSTSYAPQRPTPTSELFQEDACSEDGMEGFPSRVNAQCPISPCRHFLGKMNVLCPNCKAWHWMDEKLTRSSKKKPLFGTCCLQGKVRLPLLITPPPPLQALYDGNDDQSKSFRTHTREYNAAYAFTSLGATLDTRVLSGRGPTSVTIHGELRHRTGSLLPVPGQQASYAQLYIYDPNSAVEVRTHRNPHLRRDVLQTIQDSLLQVNAFVGKLFQEFLVDAWAATEQNRLEFHKLNQEKMRTGLYQDLTDVGIDDIGPDQIRQRVVLPSSFIGSPRHMFEIFQDSMAITRYNHHPDIFLTMTANPKWPEITASLLPHQNAIDRPDLVARVFELKRKALMKEIEQNNVFGKKVAHVFTIEFQKRGLPHMHTLLFLQGPDKIRTCAQVDNLVSTEFPDPQDDPELFETVKCCMVHGPCGARNPQSPCMVDGKCSKRYPQDFVESTTMDQDGYPVYRRRRSDKVHTVRGQPVDNRDVVPYNAYLSRRFNCHINVEVCAGMRCVKYIHKYIYKGYDCTTMVLGSINEIQQYLNARYIRPPEAAWRIFGHHLHEEVPTVVDVQVDIDRRNNAQCKAYDAITSSVLQNRGRIFFVSGGAGTGKTFLYNTIALKCRSLGHIVVTVASSGIASLLLVGGRTAHLTFCIPLDVMENSICVFSKQSIHVELFRQTKLIIWDEVPMQHKHCVEAVDRTLRDICNCEKPFGGITVVLGGDFRQILPVITKGVREQIVNASLRHSVLWKEINVLTLNVNMRLDQADQGNANFAKFLLEIGTNPQETIKLPPTIQKCQDLNELLSTVYPQLHVVGEAFTYLAADRICEEDKIDRTITNRYPNEFLNSLDPPGLPPFKVELKVGCPIMLLRNIAPKVGLCNGTRLMVVRCASRIIEALILSGEKFGNLAFIPRITLTPSSSEFPFQMTRRQFPIQLAYALTINKSQGQSVKFVGVDLHTPVFSHGQLYVALSRCTSFDRISVLLSKDELHSTTNIVYPEVLL
ncbi:hypothetical protein RHMOL_Rhmol05G0130700 [Rhododendron molle]|uniref:Uncharacterized protein n=1 Tax=Rhododendron molle TaxID=49168 RepID=A0ACC0NQV7_RHOML|nr:hypothetical protein RHMOL_Rhmol05G0130700 [Rhododendron molle]